ncbi:MAG TPA: amino acid ABC transporter permease [Tetragenococcus sp.]|nr:amino acid ABC transporter permease [Tetragenococcus sp.]
MGNNFARLLTAMVVVIKISLIALLLGVAIGLVFGVLRTTNSRLLRFIFKIYMEIFRIVPLLVLLFAFYYIVPEMLNTHIANQTVSIVVFVLWISAEMSDLVRSGIENVPQNQVEIGKSLGFSRTQLYRFIYLPQGLKTVIPGVINLVTRVIKTTSLLMMIGVTEMIRVGTQIIENYTVNIPTASLWVYGLIFFLYFFLCYPLSKWAKYLEKQVNL